MGMDPITLGLVAGGLLGGASIYQGEQARKAQSEATREAKQNAIKAEADSTRQMNAAGAKAPDTGALMAANEAAAKGGAGSTMLTGVGGVDPSLLTLGKNTLLGGG